MTFKDVKPRSWEDCLAGMANVLAETYGEHRYLLIDGNLELERVDTEAGETREKAFTAALRQKERQGQPGSSANATLVAPPTKPAARLAPSPCRGASMSDLFFQDGRAQAPMQPSTPGMRHPAPLAGERPGPRASLDACAATGE